MEIPTIFCLNQSCHSTLLQAVARKPAFQPFSRNLSPSFQGRTADLDSCCNYAFLESVRIQVHMPEENVLVRLGQRSAEKVAWLRSQAEIIRSSGLNWHAHLSR